MFIHEDITLYYYLHTYLCPTTVKFRIPNLYKNDPDGINDKRVAALIDYTTSVYSSFNLVILFYYP